jgi:hypothetical protein
MDKGDITIFDKLMRGHGIDSVPTNTVLENIGRLVDLSGKLKRAEGTARALEWCDALAKLNLSDSEVTVLEYFRANAWANLQNERSCDPAAAWAWEQPELQQQILCLRRAVINRGFEAQQAIRRCQILTNLGNQLNTVGRFVDALESWNRALSLDGRFAMALGNRGLGLIHYSNALYDRGHRAVFLKFAHDDLTAASGPLARWDSPGCTDFLPVFEAGRKRVESAFDVKNFSRTLNLDKYCMGRSKKERQYRRWCLENRLFLNPLNDLGAFSIAGRDVLTLPNFIAPIRQPPSFVGFFNQLKQEFVSARWMFFEGSMSNVVHFSDRGVLLFNTLDYPAYSLAIEKVKAAYRAAYSLFDKIAFFLNAYLKLVVDPSKVYFRRVWYQDKRHANRSIRAEFKQSGNWPLRGLFWLSKDLFDPAFHDATEPDARALDEVRNHLEHKYFKVHEAFAPVQPDPGSPSALWADTLAFSIQRSDLEGNTLRLLKLSRAALTYLSLGMHWEERRRATNRGKARVVPIGLDVWEDDWKR